MARYTTNSHCTMTYLNVVKRSLKEVGLLFLMRSADLGGGGFSPSSPPLPFGCATVQYNYLLIYLSLYVCCLQRGVKLLYNFSGNPTKSRESGICAPQVLGTAVMSSLNCILLLKYVFCTDMNTLNP